MVARREFLGAGCHSSDLAASEGPAGAQFTARSVRGISDRREPARVDPKDRQRVSAGRRHADGGPSNRARRRAPRRDQAGSG